MFISKNNFFIDFVFVLTAAAVVVMEDMVDMEAAVMEDMEVAAMEAVDILLMAVDILLMAADILLMAVHTLIIQVKSSNETLT